MSDDVNIIDGVVYAIRDLFRSDPRFVDFGVYGNWPENADFKLPALSILAFNVSIDKGDGRVYRETSEGIFYLIGYYNIDLELSLWINTKTERAKYDRIITDLFYPSEPAAFQDAPGLGLKINPLPYKDTVRVDLIDIKNHDEQTAFESYYRNDYKLSCDAPYLRFIKHGSALSISTKTVIQ